MSKSKILYRKRDFLNAEEYHSLAALFGEIKVEWTSRNKSEDNAPDIDYITFQISDCIRRIDLDFDTETEKDWKNSFAKLEKLETFIQEFKEHMKELYEMKDVKEKDESEDRIRDMLIEEFNNYIFANKIDGREIQMFDIERETNYKIRVEFIEPDDISLEDNSFKEFVREKEEEYDIKIKATVYE